MKELGTETKNLTELLLTRKSFSWALDHYPQPGWVAIVHENGRFWSFCDVYFTFDQQGTRLYLQGWNIFRVPSLISRQLNSSPLLPFCFIQPFVSLSFPLWRHRLRYTLLQLSTHTYTQTCTQATERRGGRNRTRWPHSRRR